MMMGTFQKTVEASIKRAPIGQIWDSWSTRWKTIVQNYNPLNKTTNPSDIKKKKIGKYK